MQCPLAPWTPPGIPPHPLISTTKQKERETSKHSEPRESQAGYRPKIFPGPLTSRARILSTDCRLPCPARRHCFHDFQNICGAIQPPFPIPEPLQLFIPPPIANRGCGHTAPGCDL